MCLIFIVALYHFFFILAVRLDLGQILGGLNNNQGSSKNKNNMNQHLQEKISIIGQLLGNNNGGGGGNPNDPLGSLIGGILDNVQVDVSQNDQGQFQFGVNPKPGGAFGSTTMKTSTMTRLLIYVDIIVQPRVFYTVVRICVMFAANRSVYNHFNK